MKIIVGAFCNGMSEADTEEQEVDDTTSDEELEEIAREHGYSATGFEYWYKKKTQEGTMQTLGKETLNCPECQTTLWFKQFQGMRVVEEGILSAQCPNCKTHYTMPADASEPKTKKTRVREVNKIFTCSTAHMTKEDADLLRASDDVSHFQYESGNFIHVPSDHECYKEFLERCISDGYSNDFIRLIKIAKDLGCIYLQLDRDGETYEDLLTFDW